MLFTLALFCNFIPCHLHECLRSHFRLLCTGGASHSLKKLAFTVNSLVSALILSTFDSLLLEPLTSITALDLLGLLNLFRFRCMTLSCGLYFCHKQIHGILSCSSPRVCKRLLYGRTCQTFVADPRVWCHGVGFSRKASCLVVGNIETSLLPCTSSTR